MRSLPLVALLLVTACAGEIDSGGTGGGGGDDVVTGPDAAIEPVGNEAVARAQQWVDVQVPYCQAPNHARDYDAECSMTCTRPDNAEWDPYRSDCSGFVSFAWGLPSPGRTTKTFAPFDTTVSMEIPATELVPGDAVNNDHHMMLFKGWVVPGVQAIFMDEPGCSSATPYAHEFMAMVTLDDHVIVVAHHGTFTAIRQTH